MGEKISSESNCNLPVRIREILRCPICRATLDCSESFLRCTNGSCRVEFPVIDGVPILINEQTSVFTFAEFLGRKPTFFPPASHLKRAVSRWLPSLGRNFRAKDNLRRFARELLVEKSKPLVLIIGGSVVGEGSEELLSNPAIEFVQTDVALSQRVGLVCDCHDLPFAEDCF